MKRFNPHFQLPDETEIESNDFPTDNQQIHFVFDFANTLISAERLGYEFDFSVIANKYPKIKKHLFLTEKDLIRYKHRLKGYTIHASPGKNCDVEITLYINSLIANKRLKQVYFFSGDGDFQPVLALLQEKGIAIKCPSFSTSFSTRLLSVAEFVPVGQDLLQPLFKKEVK